MIIAAAGLLGYQLFDVIRVRVDGWINPWLDPSAGRTKSFNPSLPLAAVELLGMGRSRQPGANTCSPIRFYILCHRGRNGLIGTIGCW
jgi:hypothetical protein